MHLLFLVTVYSTINVRVNNYCVALFLARKKRPFGRFCFVISYVHSEHNVYLFTYFVASSQESPYDSISSFMISSSEKLCFLNDDTKIFMELILSSATAFSITSHLFITTILLSRYNASNYRYRTRYTGFHPCRTILSLARPLSSSQRLLCACCKILLLSAP